MENFEKKVERDFFDVFLGILKITVSITKTVKLNTASTNVGIIPAFSLP